MGLPAAGKSTLVQQRYASRRDYLIIDPDAIAEALPGYDPKKPELTHGMASQIAEDSFAQALTSMDQHIVMDTTGTKADKLIRRMEAARRAGFGVHLLYVTVPLEVSLARNRQRERVVPDWVIMEKAAQIGEAFERVRAHVDAIEVIDTSTGATPRSALQTATSLGLSGAIGQNPVRRGKSSRPPGAWWHQVRARVRAAPQYRDRSAADIDRITAGIWHRFSRATQRRILQATEKNPEPLLNIDRSGFYCPGCHYPFALGSTGTGACSGCGALVRVGRRGNGLTG